MRLITADQLAIELNCSSASVRVWTRKGMPVQRIGRLTRYDVESVLAWFRERAATVDAEGVAG